MQDLLESNIILENDRARLEPLAENHFEELWPVAQHEELWALTTSAIKTKEDFIKYFDTAIEEKKKGLSYPFAIFDKDAGRYGGCTRFGNIDNKHKRLEIGWTWYEPALQRTGLNRNCKFLLLRYGFETMGLNRIELKTSTINFRSQKAMEQIGAVKEGVFRNHMVNPDGSLRHSVYYSFIKEDWPQIKAAIFKNYF